MREKPPQHASFSARAYFLTFLALGILLVITVLAARLHMGGLSTLISLAIAAIKAILVAIIFMHLRIASKSTWVFAGAGLLWLAIMFTFTASDFMSRGLYSSEPSPPPLVNPSNPEMTAPVADRAIGRAER